MKDSFAKSGLKVRVVVADRHHVVRRALAALLATVPGIAVVGEAEDAEQAVERVLEADPDVLVLDIAMPGIGGIEAARRIRASHPRTEIVVLTEQRSEAYQKEAFQAGVRGYLNKDCTLEMLVDGVRHAAQGEFYLPGSAGRDLVSEYVKPLLRNQQPGGIVTPRERQLACLLADGYSTKEAAAVLSISVKTAETHRTSIMRKLGAKNVSDVVKYCIRNHLIDV